MSVVFRIAPTPSGFLHPGNAWSFLLTASLAKAFNGKLLLRIDDLDTDRKRHEFIEDIFESLHWLGIEWDLGPKDANDFEKNYSQLMRIPFHEELLSRLANEDKVFACTCSRSVLPQRNPYPGNCKSKNISLDADDVAWRVKVNAGEQIEFIDEIAGKISNPLSETMGSFVVRTRHGFPAYQLASLVDDLHYGVNFIVRGEDLLHSTAVQLHLAKIIGNDSFAQSRFLHHPLLKDSAGEKLSKSAGAYSLKEIRRKKKSPDVIHDWFEKTTGIDFRKPGDEWECLREKIQKLKNVTSY